MKSYTTLRNLFGSLTANTSSTNLTLGDQLINDSLRYLTTKYFFNERTQVVPGGTVASQQAYDLPYNIKQIVNIYISVGSLRYTLTECPNRKFWDALNFAPYTSDIPQYYFRFNKEAQALQQDQFLVFPTPATSSNVITVVYKTRLKDLTYADYSTGTVSLTTLTSAVTGSGTSWFRGMAGAWIQFPENITSATTSGDGNWYEIASTSSTTALTLINQYQGATIAGANYTIGEMPLLPEDYHDMPVYKALEIYFTTRVPDPSRAQLFKGIYDEKFAKLDAEFGSKSSSVAIVPNNAEVANPNLFIRSIG